MNNYKKQLFFNHNLQIYDADVRELKFGDISREIDLISAGPPCQPFSIGGKHLAYEDKRDLFDDLIRAIFEIRPKAFLIENVKGLTRKSFSDYFEYILLGLTYPAVHQSCDPNWKNALKELEIHHTSQAVNDLKYNVTFRLLNATDYGVPQKRERVFIVGFREDLNVQWSFPEATHSFEELLRTQWIDESYWDEHAIPKSERPSLQKFLKKRVDRLKNKPRIPGLYGQRWQTVRDAISTLPHLESEDNNCNILNHELRQGARIYPGHTGSFIDEPAKTLKAGDHGVPGGENMIRYADGRVRYFSVRESARLQTFPDKYEFVGSWTEGMRQLGNAVPVRLAEILAQKIHKSLSCVS
ncbi:DNA cytosine methyltransferase M.NgoMIII [Geitlerinema sp. FC II]|nr:DNA cytosine methyltransferase M.NgoMIII [Geitlerinema sp. FC II]